MVIRDHGGSASTPERQPEQPARRTRRQTAAVLGGVPMFADFTKRHLNRLAADTDELTFAPGQIIVTEGDPGETLFVVLEGQAKVVRGKRKVGEVLPGDFFGELSAIDGGPRTASVIATTPMRVLRSVPAHAQRADRGGAAGQPEAARWHRPPVPLRSNV